MNQRIMVQLELIKNERTYTFSIPYGSALEDAHEVALQMGAAIKIAIEDRQKAQAQTQTVEKTEEQAS
jgi:electron transfer flavoprotein alpha/beta subunit